MKISDNIKKYRKEKGLTQKELADKIGRSLRMLQKYESGEVEPSIEVLNEIAKELGTNFFDFIEIPEASVLYSEDSVRVASKNKITPTLINEIVESLMLNGELHKSFFIGDDLEVLTDSIKRFIINEITIITDKNLMIMEAMEHPDEFYKKYMSNHD